MSSIMEMNKFARAFNADSVSKLECIDTTTMSASHLVGRLHRDHATPTAKSFRRQDRLCPLRHPTLPHWPPLQPRWGSKLTGIRSQGPIAARLRTRYFDPSRWIVFVFLPLLEPSPALAGTTSMPCHEQLHREAISPTSSEKKCDLYLY